MSTSVRWPQLIALDRSQLAALGREYMLFGQLNDRVALPLVGRQFGPAAMQQIAIEEWMGASPVYTPLMRRALGFDGNDVATILKGLQLDVGFAHEFFDVGYSINEDGSGDFWLKRCGALLDVEPFGEKQVVSMCHHVEDPTFDATACATNPRARIRPIHRPPRMPKDRGPHCHWRIKVDPEAEELPTPLAVKGVAQSGLAQLEFASLPIEQGEGLPNYAGAFKPDLQLEDLSYSALFSVCQEFLRQDHLLIRSLLQALANHYSLEIAESIGLQQWIGSGWIISERLQNCFHWDPILDNIIRLLSLHPAFIPEYTDLRIEQIDDKRARVALHECPALRDLTPPFSWYFLLKRDPISPMEAMLKGIHPGLTCLTAVPKETEAFAWDIHFDSTTHSAPEPEAVRLGRLSGPADFTFRNRSH